jgi:hypothetical protein
VRPIWGITGPALRRALAQACSRRDDDRGAVAIVVAAMLTVFIGLAALVVDRGLAADAQRQSQSTSDASALAAALVLSRGGSAADADAAARAYALADFEVTPDEWSSCSATLQAGFSALGGTSCISHNTTTRAVHVVLPTRHVPSSFGTIFGVTSLTVASAATAGYGPPGGTPDCVLCVLSLLHGQTGGIQVSNGDAVGQVLDFNNANGSIEMTNGDIGYGTSYSPSATYTKDGTVVVPHQVPGLVDPFADLVTSLPPLSPVPAVSGSGACRPGNYTDVGNCATFAPGTYVITGDNRNSNLPTSASGVLFFFTCSDAAGRPTYCPAGGGKGGTFEAAGRSTLTLTGLNDPASPYNNFAILVDPNNDNQQKWAGRATLVVNGIVHDANASTRGGFSDRGNGQLTVNGRLVLGYLELAGVGSDKVHVNVTGPPPGSSPSAVNTIPHLTQ